MAKSLNWYFLLCLALAISSKLLFGQDNHSVDSLEVKLLNTEELTEKVEVLNQLAMASNDFNDAQKYAELAIDLVKDIEFSELKFTARKNLIKVYLKAEKYTEAESYLPDLINVVEKFSDTSEMASANYEIGKLLIRFNRLIEAADYFENAAELYKIHGDDDQLIKALNKAGIIQKNIKNYPKALDYYHTAFPLAQKSNNKIALARIRLNIGVVLKKQKLYPEAKKEYLAALKIYEGLSNYVGMANTLNNLGNINRITGNSEKALQQYKKALKYRKESGNTKQVAYTLNNIGIVYNELEMYDSAEYYLQASLNEKLKNNNLVELSSTFLNFTEVYLNTNDTAKFHKFYELGVQNAAEFKEFDVLSELYLNKSKMYVAENNYKDAHNYLLKVVSHLDTANQDSKLMISSYAQAKFNAELQMDEIKDLAEANYKLENANTTLQQQAREIAKKERANEFMIYILIGLLILLLTILTALYTNFVKLKKNRLELSEANKHLMSSRITIEEKTTLIKEIHHRVKNNLQIIKSIIRLQNAKVSNQEFNDILLDFENRIMSMGLVHESLYKTKDFLKLQVSDYFAELLNNLDGSFSTNHPVEFNKNIKSEDLSIDTLIPLGLITNEIVSNAYKYAFKNNDKPELTFLFLQENQNWTLKICDNGDGFDYHHIIKDNNTLGTDLIETLTEQLNGTLTYTDNSGSCYQINFRNLT